MPTDKDTQSKAIHYASSILNKDLSNNFKQLCTQQWASLGIIAYLSHFAGHVIPKGIVVCVFT